MDSTTVESVNIVISHLSEIITAIAAIIATVGTIHVRKRMRDGKR